MTYRTQIIENQMKLAREEASQIVTPMGDLLAALEKYDHSGQGLDGEVREGITWRMALLKNIAATERALAATGWRLARAKLELDDQ